MTPMQKRLYHGRTLSCQRCAKPFTVTEATPEPVPAPALGAWPERTPPPPASGPVSAGADVSPGAAAPAETPGAADAQATPGLRPPRKKPGDGMTPGRMALLILGAGAAVLLVLYVALMPSINRARETSRRAACVGNLQQIGVALQIYANRAAGRFPDSLDPLVLDGTLRAAALVCPSSDDTVAPGVTLPEQLAEIAGGGHLSYVYIGRGLTITAVRQPIVYEPLHHHHPAGIHVLYTDGTVQFIPANIAITAFPQLAAPTTGPAANPQTAPAAR